MDVVLSGNHHPLTVRINSHYAADASIDNHNPVALIRLVQAHPTQVRPALTLDFDQRSAGPGMTLQSPFFSHGIDEGPADRKPSVSTAHKPIQRKA